MAEAKTSGGGVLIVNAIFSTVGYIPTKWLIPRHFAAFSRAQE